MTTQIMPVPANIIPEGFLPAARAEYGNTLTLALMEISALTSLADGTNLANLFAPAERRQLAGFRLDKRRQQWLAGRLCAKQAVSEQSIVADPASIIVLNREDGSPYVSISGRQSTRLHLSISHSGELAAGLVADNHCGVDIQEERQTLLNVRQRFCSPDEDTLLSESLQSFSPVQQLNLLWSCKEAIRKMFNHHRIPGFLQVSCSEVINKHENLFSFRFLQSECKNVLSVLCCALPGYALATCVLKEKYDA